MKKQFKTGQDQTLHLTFFCYLLIYFLSAISLAPHAGHAQSQQSENPPHMINIDRLPDLVKTMQENLKTAAQNADLEELNALFESNELAPLLGPDHTSNPITYWQQHSLDGTARDILASMVKILSLPPLKLNPSKEQEASYIWPYFTRTPLDHLTKAQQIELFALVGPEQAITMLKENRYTYYELEIGEDGTWHSFKKNHKPEKNEPLLK